MSKLRRSQIALLAILFVALVLRLWHLGNQLAGVLPHSEYGVEMSDIVAFTRWAAQIADGDWLCRSHFHPYMDWMRDCAPLAQFEEWWGGKEIYHQNPLFPYLLAISYLVSGGSSVPLLILQVLLSTFSVFLVYDLARRFVDERAGLVAAGLLAVFAPSVVFDAILLRASLNSSLTLLSVWLLLRLENRVGWRPALGAGVCVAASFMLRPTGLALLVIGPLLLLQFADLRRRWRQWIPALMVGVVLVVGPFVIRNLIVGAPSLAFSTRGPETVIHSQTKSVDPGFMRMPAAEQFRQYMNDGSSSMAAAIMTSIDSWPGETTRLKDGRVTVTRGSVGWWLWHEWQKTICMFRDYEYSNNINFYFYRRATPLLQFLPTFGWFVGLGLVGLVLIAAYGRQRRLALIGLLALGALYLGGILGFALGRYRLPLAVMMTVPAGAAVSLVISWLRSGSRRRIGVSFVALAVAAGISALSFTVHPQRVYFDDDGQAFPRIPGFRIYYEHIESLRPQEFLSAADYLFKQGDRNRARQVLEQYADECEAFYNEVSAEARSSDIRCLVFLRQKHRERCLLLGEALQAIGETQKASELVKQAEHIRRQLEKMR